MAKYDVVVVGAGNAAFCAAQAAREKGAKRADGRARAEGADGRQFPLHRRRLPLRLRRRRRSQGDHAGPDQGRDRSLRFRHLHTDQFYDDMFRVTQYRTDGDLCDRLVGRSRDAMRWLHVQGHEVRSDLGPSGLSDRRQVQVLGRPHGRIQGRRAGPDRAASQARREAGHRGSLRHSRASRWSTTAMSCAACG